MARFSPVRGSSNFGQSTPGMSIRSSPSDVGTHCFVSVTPGLSSTLTFLPPHNRLISDDLPTFGIPTTMARSFRPLIPRAAYRCTLSARICRITVPICPIPSPVTQSMASAFSPRARNVVTQAFVTAGSAREDLFRSVRTGFPAVSAAISGLRALSGIRASTSSNTISTCERFSRMIRRVFAICPGNHWIVCIVTSVNP